MLAISCAHFRRNRAAVVHSVIQPFFQRRSAPADGNAARDDLPVCDESLRAMAKACVGRRTTDDALHYGRTQALKNIELSIPERKITAFIGPSGCGKSTLLRTFNKMYTLYPEQRA